VHFIKRTTVVSLTGMLVAALAGVFSTAAHAVPSFARQTGMACAACHTAFPELTAFGRQFKLDGYVLQNTPQVSDGDAKAPSLQVSAIPPLSVMFEVSYTDTKGADKAQQGTRTNLQFPEQFSLFYAGEITPHMGAFIQVTHTDNSGGFSMDNSEIRYADHTQASGKDLLFGIVANNNPGMSDVWQATPVWGYPFAGPLGYEAPLSSGLGGAVGGVGAYAMYDGSFYAEVMMYKTMGSGGQDTGLAGDPWSSLVTPVGGTAPVEAVAGWAPYFKLAYQNTFADNFIQVGLSGMDTHVFATGTGTSGPTNSYKDIGLDLQYERPLGNDSIVVRSAIIKETIGLDAYRGAVDPAQADVSFRVAKLNGSYHLGSDKVFSLGFVNTSGDGTAPGATTGTRAYIAEAAYYPWENVRLSAQYTSYSKFMGSTTSASDNNTIYLLGWFVF